MDYRDPGVWFDLATEFIFNACNFMLGYMVASGKVVEPSGGAWLAAVLTGFVGAANHARALRKPSTTA